LRHATADLTHPDSLLTANVPLLDGIALRHATTEPTPDACIAPNAHIAPDTHITPNTRIAPDTCIAPDAHIAPNTHIASNAHIAPNTSNPPLDIDECDSELGEKHTLNTHGSFIREFIDAEPSIGETDRVQFPREQASSKVPKATHDAIAAAMKLKMTRFQAALERVHEKVEIEVAETAKEFDMKDDVVLSKLQHDSRWSSKKHGVNLWNTVIYVRSIIEKNSKICSHITAYLDLTELHCITAGTGDSDMVMLSDIVKKVQKDMKSLSNTDKAMLQNSLEEHCAVRKTGYRVASKAQQ
jgi:hypothetical protein